MSLIHIFIKGNAERFYILIDGEKVYVDDSATADVDSKLGDAGKSDIAIVAYKTQGGKIVGATDADILIIKTCADINGNWMNNYTWDDNTGYQLTDGNIQSYNDTTGELKITGAVANTELNNETEISLWYEDCLLYTSRCV